MPTKNHFAQLDGLRGIAAAVVLFAHACDLSGAAQLFPKKYLSVYFFFMLSGFVVSCSYEGRLQRGMSPAQFLTRRAVRLYPLVALGTLLCVAYLLAFNPAFGADPHRFAAAAFSIVGLPYPFAEFSNRQFPINPPGWSLFYELLAYIAFGIGAAKMKTRPLLVCTAAAFAVFGFVGAFYQGHRMPLYGLLFTALAPFAAGMLLWRNYASQLLHVPALPFWILASLIAVVCAIPDSISRALDAVVVLFVFTMVMMSGSARGPQRAGRTMTFLGDISFPVYILHWPVLLLANTLLKDSLQPMAVAAIGCTAAVVVAFLAFRLFDLPLRANLNARLNSGQALKIAPVA